MLDGHGPVATDGHPAEGRPRAPLRRNPPLPVPTFLAQAIEKVAWHANEGHHIVLVSGTLLPLARRAASAMEAELAARGITVTIRVLATRLEELDGRWTGRILGPAMVGEAKARAPPTSKQGGKESRHGLPGSWRQRGRRAEHSSGWRSGIWRHRVR